MELGGVELDGELINPYENPDVMVTEFESCALIAHNLRNIRSCDSRPADTQTVQLGNTTIRGEIINFHLEVDIYNQGCRTAARDHFPTISIVSRDAHDYNRLVDIIRAQFTADHCLKFHDFYRLAMRSTSQEHDTTWYLDQLSEFAWFDRPEVSPPVGAASDPQCVEASMDGTVSCLRARTAITDAIEALHKATLLEPFQLPGAMTLHAAWHCYVRHWRLPRFETAVIRLEEAAAYIDNAAVAFITSGVDADGVRECWGVLQRRLFLLRFMMTAYTHGVWE